MSATEEAEVVVVGASAAGLASAACLQRRGVVCVLLDRASCVGTAWRGHYDRLHLHTNRGASGLPFFPMPRSYPRYPARDQVVAYLEAYARHFDLQPRFGQEVASVRRGEDGWLVETAERRYRAAHVVIATGYTRRPYTPTWPGQDRYRGELLHSSAYKSGASWKGQPVLVVGFGNSGGEIAIDLHEHGAQPAIAVRSPVNVVPRDFLGVPILGLGIALRSLPVKLADALARPVIHMTVGDIAKLGLRKLPYGPNEQIRRHGRIPLLDIGTIDLIRRGAIAVRPGLERFEGEQAVRFLDGRKERFAAVVLATGYRPALSDFLEPADEVTDEHGVPTASGHETLPGLYFCGFYVSPAGMLREIGIEARRIAAAIAGPRTRPR